jgi:hypothetical protein
MGVSGQCDTPASLHTQGKTPPFPPHPRDRKLPVWTQRLEKISFLPAWNQNSVVQTAVKEPGRSVSIVTGYGLGDRDSNPGKGGGFFL